MSMMTTWPGFADSIARARRQTGLPDSVTIEIVDEGGVRAVLVTGHFSFLGGSMGVDHGNAVVHALDRARELECAVVFLTSSGGARTQEGFDALFQMPRTMLAVQRHRSARLPIISVFRHPTTGGVHASYGAAADIVIAEVGATVGFAGPRVVAALTGTRVETGESHTAEVYYERGLVDELVQEGEGLASALRWVRRLTVGTMADPVAAAPQGTAEVAGWAAVERARAPMRPSARRVASFLFTDQREIRGDRAGIDDRVVIAGFGSLAGMPAVVIGTDREAPGISGLTGAPHAAGFRKATRAVRIASRLGLPVISLVDTRGADPSAGSDNSGLASSISELMLALFECRSPTVCAVIGEGGSGGAMAFASTDVLLMQEDSVFEVIAPEGAAAILCRDAGRASLIADQMPLDAMSLQQSGHVDAVLSGPTTAGVFPSLAHLRTEIRSQLMSLCAVSEFELRRRRVERYSRTGRRHGSAHY